MTISELIEQLGVNKTLANETYTAYKKLKDAEEALKMQLHSKLLETGLKSAKGDKYTASITEKPSIVINHEQSILDWLKESPDVEVDAYIGLKATPFKSLAMQVLKETGEVIPGTELQTTESLSIRANKKG